LDTGSEEEMNALPNRHHNGQKGTTSKNTWRKKWKQQALSPTGERWRQQPKIELNGVEWSLGYALHREKRA